MKSRALIIFILSITLISSVPSNAQLGLGFNFGSMNWGQNYGVTEDGKSTGFYSPKSGNSFGLELYYILKPKMRVNLELDLMTTAVQETTAPIFLGSPSYIYINIVHPAIMVRADFQYDIIHDFTTKGLSLYALGGVALNAYGYTTNYGAVIPGSNGNTYSSKSPDQYHTYRSGSLSLGLGVEYAFNYTTHLFLDVRGCTGETTQFKSSKLQNDNFLPENFNPGYAKLALGMRFNVGKAKE